MKFIIVIALGFFSRAEFAFANAGEAIGKTITYAATGFAGYNLYKGMQKGGDCYTSDKTACVMMGLYVAQAVTDLSTAKSGKSTTQGFLPPGEDWDSTIIGPGKNGTQIDQDIKNAENKASSAIADLKKKGINVDKSTGKISTKNGAMSAGDLSSGKALAEAGLIDPSQISEADAALAKMKADQAAFKLKMPSVGNTAGGGYVAKGAAKGGDYQDPYKGFNFGGEKEKPNAPKTAGLVKMAGGDAIGSQTDNIFDMLHRKYQQKTAENTFVQDP